MGALLCMLAGGALTALVLAGGGWPDAPDPYIRRVAGFTLLQAVLSALLSLLLGVPVARMLHRRVFPGRGGVIRLFALCFVTPPIAVVLGVTQVHGANGWVNTALRAAGLDGGSYLYGLGGILLAHLFLNMPLAALGFLHALRSVPVEQWRLAAQLGLGDAARFRLIEWPAMRGWLPGLAALIMVLCFASFAITLSLGGGPGATILEVEIYHALRFDFDPARAAMLALLQITICVLFTAVVMRLRPPPSELSGGGDVIAAAPPGRAALYIDISAFALALAVVAPPLAAILLSGLNPALIDILLSPALHQAALTSLLIAAPSGALATGAALALLAASRTLTLDAARPRLAAALENIGALGLLFPPFALAAGLFLLLRPLTTDVMAAGPLLVMLINACTALPYALRILAPAYHRAGRERDRLCRSLGISGAARFRLADWPVIRRPLALGLGLATSLSLGDFGVVALFGGRDFVTLPLFIQRHMGAYRMQEAAAGVLLLLLCCAALLALAGMFGGRRRDA